MPALTPRLRSLLARARLQALGAEPGGGVGERRSRTKGPGIEFEDHRRYQTGDDLRYLDPHVYARHGQHYVRQFSVDRQLSIGIGVDLSASMAYGHPDKADFARSLATALAFLGVTHGDRVQVGVGRAGAMTWFAGLHGPRQIDRLSPWLEGARPAGLLPLTTIAASLADRMSSPGLAFVLSDWWAPDAASAAALLRRAGHAVVAVHVLSPEEIDASRLGRGPVLLVDLETGDEEERTLDAELARRYDAALTEHRSRLEEELVRAGARYVFARSDVPLEELLLRDWRRAGLVL